MPGLDSLTLAKSISCTVAVGDAAAPVSVVSPFYYTSAAVNSLYGLSPANGHIELTGVVNGADPDVSGKVKIEGTAYDDQLIRRIYARIDGLTFGAATVTLTAASSTVSTGSTAHGLAVGDIVYFAGTLPSELVADTAYYVLTVPTTTSFTVTATWSGTTAIVPATTGSSVTATAYRRMATYASGSWTVVPDSLASNGWDFSVANSVMDQDSHQAHLDHRLGLPRRSRRWQAPTR